MSDRDKLVIQFEAIGQAALEISRIMKQMSEKDKTMSKREFAVKQSRERMADKSEKVLEDLSKPFPPTNEQVLLALRKCKEKL